MQCVLRDLITSIMRDKKTNVKELQISVFVSNELLNDCNASIVDDLVAKEAARAVMKALEQRRKEI